MSKLWRLDLALRLLDLAREHAALDDLAFLHAGHLQQALGAHRVAEDAHQVVFHRQIEAARARVALAAGTAAQLVVDAAGLVTLRADDVQAAGGDHLVVPRLPFGAHARAAARRRSRRASASSASRLPPSTMSVPRPAMLVAMVTAPGRPACATMCASRSCCFAFSTSCGTSCFFSRPERNSEVSMDVVPTSAGCSRVTQSRMSSMIASNLSFCVR